METVQYLLRTLFKLAIVTFFAAIVWWAVITFNPGFTIRSLFFVGGATTTTGTSTQASGGWLPSPRIFRGGQAGPIVNKYNKDSYGPIFSGYDNQKGQEFELITYTDEGAKKTKYIVTSSNSGNSSNSRVEDKVEQAPPVLTQYDQKSSYIRNLSIYEGGRTYTGLTFVGEARASMFLNGKFPIVIAEQATGRVLSVSFAEAVSDWTVPGWVRFRVKINTIAPSVSKGCLMVFEQARVQNSQAQPTRVLVHIQCN